MLGFLSLSWLLILASLVTAQSTKFQLTTDNYDTEIARGYWFVEHTSPYCGHCKHFEPTWESLIAIAASVRPEVRLAQINCVEHGDLCDKNDIKAYPTMLFFEDGKIIDKYKGPRTVLHLLTFLKLKVNKLDAPPAPTDHYSNIQNLPSPHLPNPWGEVKRLDSANFSSTLQLGRPTFVKFYAPWCGHSKAFAPVWYALAKDLRGQAEVAEVDCVADQALCETELGRVQNLQGYPTLVFYNPQAGGHPIVYDGDRGLERLREFAQKEASGYAAELSKLELYVREGKVVYVLFYNPMHEPIVNTIRADAAALNITAPIYATSSSGLRIKYGISTDIPWMLISLKDHNLDTPTEYFAGTMDKDHQKWMLENQLPGYLELTRKTFRILISHRVPRETLVVLAPSTAKLSKEIEVRMAQMSKEWRRTSPKGYGFAGDKEVIFGWMDREVWEGWMKEMYNLEIDADEEDVEKVRVVVVDHKELLYYDQDRDGRALTVTAPDRLFQSLREIGWGTLGYKRSEPHKHSENVGERLVRWLNTEIEESIQKPLMFVVFLFLGVGVVFWTFNQRSSRGEVESEEEDEKTRLG